MSQYGYSSRFGSPGGISIGPAGPVPPAIKTLIGVNTAVFVAQELAERLGLIPRYALGQVFGLIPAEVAHFHIWQLFTYQFLHAGVWHLAVNMLMLWMFGSELEQRWGRRFFVRYYMLCAVGGGITYTLAQWGTWTPTVGASGAIFGVLMAYGLWFPNRIVLLGFLIPVRVRHVVLFLIFVELLQAMEATGTGIAYAAHLGGMLFGFVYLRWWTQGGLGLGPVPGWNDVRRAYRRWRFRRLQRKRFPGNGPTLH